ncbi:PTS sugar transporter subunit IIA [Thorsellia anophelis]|uniref:PTS system galactitol-specific EIIA component, Gat family n=1 Tax=Thorsellia anophelis DSM 18579 TaxID=1123402 RepID=A0A1I0F0A4_9GAMM|nr:PTS sugar transporter subunit IIA [Thorsellia anophelis]SET50811.1 PTS system galactitol-specific EIIA component, Gat family [Thorsellia anophelis DSM 18579]
MDVLVKVDITLNNKDDLFNMVAEDLIKKEYVKNSYLEALKSRETEFPTGINFGFGQLAIPHCEAEHSNKACIYITKLKEAIEFENADGDGVCKVKTAIFLVVTDPKDQIGILKKLFGFLQSEDNFLSLEEEDDSEVLKIMFTHQVV